MYRYKFYFIAIILSITATEAVAQKPNVLTKSEKQNGWRLLFDGKTFNGLQKLANTGWLLEKGS